MSEHAGIGVEIAGCHQALAQRRHRRMAAAEPQAVGLRHLRPAALGDDAFELRDRLLGVLHGRRRQRRQRRLRHLDGARAGVEALAEIVALVLVDQRLERRVLAERARGAMPPPASAVACRPRRTARRLGWRWSGELVIAVPEAPKTPKSSCRIGFLLEARLQKLKRRARQVPALQICVGRKGGAGRICDEWPRKCGPKTHQTPGGGNPGGLVAAEMVGEEPRKLTDQSR